MSSKKSAKSKEAVSYELRDVVLGKIRGFPPWPGMIVDPESVPPIVAKERPPNKKSTFYCVRFFPTGDFAWLVAKDISKLQPHEIEAYLSEPFKKNGDLNEGYKIARNPTEWEERLAANSIVADEEEANMEVDQLDSENEDGEAKPKAKKRKRDSEPASAKSKKAAKPKKDTSDAANKKKNGAAKPKKAGNKSKTVVESEDDGDGMVEDEDAGPSKKATPPPAKKSKRDKDGDEEVDPAVAKDPEAVKVRDWRHKLQKAFLSPKGPPKHDDIPSINEMFTAVETYDQMSISYLTFSKIGKVMRHIAILPDEKVPRDDEFKFRQRAQKLVDKWHEILNANKANGNASDGAKDMETALGTSAPNGKAEDAPAEADLTVADATMEA